MREARADLLVFADDDVEAFPTWLQSILDIFIKYPDAVLVGGKCLPSFEVTPPKWLDSLWQSTQWGRANGWLSLVDLGEEIRSIPSDYVYGCNFAIRRSILSNCGGFHPDGMPWDKKEFRGDGESHVSAWISRQGLKSYYHPLASVYHYVPKERLTFSYLCRRAFLQAISYSFMVTRDIPNFPLRAIRIARRLLEVIWHQVICGRGGVRRHWLFLIAGILWHQALLATDPALREWVAKDNYFE